MNNYRFTKNEFERRSHYWGGGGRMPERNELFTPTRRDDNRQENRYRHTKSNVCFENKRQVQSSGSGENETLSFSPTFNKRSRNKSKSNSGRGDQRVSPNAVSFNNNRKCVRKCNQSLLVSIDTRNQCCPRRVSFCDMGRGRDCARLPTRGCERPCSFQCSLGGRRTRSLTPAGLDCRPRRASCPRTICPANNPYMCWDYPTKPSCRGPRRCPPPRPFNYSPRRTPKRNLDCKNECVCFNDKSWSCSNIAVMKTFLSTANCNEVQSLMGVVRCLIRERYSTNNSNCSKPYKPNNVTFNCWPDVQPQSSDESNHTPSPTNHRADILNVDDCYQPVSSQNSKSVSFDQRSRQRKTTNSTPGATGIAKNQTFIDNEIAKKHYNSPEDENSDTSGKRYIGTKSYSSPVVNVDLISKKPQKGENQLKPHRSWSGVITDCKSFLKNSTESRCQEKRNIEANISDTGNLKPNTTQSKKSGEYMVSSFHGDTKKNADFSQWTLPTEPRQLNTQLCPVGDEQGNQFYLSKESYDQLCRFINPKDLTSPRKKKSSSFIRNAFDEQATFLNSSNYLLQKDDDDTDGNNSSTDSFQDKDKQTKDNESKVMNKRTVFTNSSSAKSNENSQQRADDNLPKALLDITTNTQHLLDKVSVRIKEVEKMWDSVESEETEEVCQNYDMGVECVERANSIASPTEEVDDITFSVNMPGKKQINSAIGEVVANNMLPEDDGSVMDVQSFEMLKKEVDDISKQLEEDDEVVQIQTKGQNSSLQSSSRKHRMGLLVRENTWVKDVSSEPEIGDGEQNGALKEKDESIVSRGNSMTSLDTNSSLSECNTSIKEKESRDDGGDKDSQKNKTDPKQMPQLNMDDIKEYFKDIKSMPVVIKRYGSSSPLPKETQIHIQSWGT